MITQFVEVTLLLVGDGTTRDFTIDLSKLPQATLNSLPGFPAGLILEGTSLIGPDGTVREEATFTLKGRIVTVQATNPLEVPGDTFRRYTLNLSFSFELN